MTGLTWWRELDVAGEPTGEFVTLDDMRARIEHGAGDLQYELLANRVYAVRPGHPENAFRYELVTIVSGRHRLDEPTLLMPVSGDLFEEWPETDLDELPPLRRSRMRRAAAWLAGRQWTRSRVAAGVGSVLVLMASGVGYLLQIVGGGWQ